MGCPGEPAQPDFGTLLYFGDVGHVHGRAVLAYDHRIFDVAHIFNQAEFRYVDLLQPERDEAAAGIGIIGRELLLYLANTETVRYQLVRIDTDLVLAGRPAEAGDIHDVGHRLELLLDDP